MTQLNTHEAIQNPNIPRDENAASTRKLITIIILSTYFTQHDLHYSEILHPGVWEILYKMWATGMRKLAESSQQCLHEIASWNGRKVLPVPGVELSLRHADGWRPCVYLSSFITRKTTRGIALDYDSHKNHAAIENKKKKKLTSWEWRFLQTVSDIPTSEWRHPYVWI